MNLSANLSTKKTSSTAGAATTDSPYLGSKISLVSKAKIRYEGILYTIDANESTVALSKVRSFGTEDRPTDRPVPARDETFEYIIFRGADIEDLQVREPPQTSLTQDPAIVESSAYPDNARSTSIGTNTSLTGLAGQGSNRSLSNRGTMPSPPSHQGQGMKGYKSSDPLRQFNMNHQRSNRSYNHQSPMMPYEGNNARRYRPSQQQDYYPLNRRSSAYPTEWNRPAQRYPRGLPAYDNNRFYPSRRNGGFQGQGQGQRQRRNSTGGMNTSSTRNGHRQHQQQQQQHQQQQQQGERTRSNGTTSRSTLKFVGDFDFEKSNAEFDKNAIEDELKKSLSLKTTKKTDGETSTDEQEKEKENQNEQEKQQHQQDQLEQHQQQTLLDTFYDKQKSFFDCISCEANEKEKTSNRRNWNEERRVNAETFGLKYRPFQQNNGGNPRAGNRRNNNSNSNYNNYNNYNNNGQRYQRTNYSGRNAGYYGNFGNRVRAY